MAKQKREAIVLGLGEIGHPIYQMLAKTYSRDEVQSYDIATSDMMPGGSYDFMHVCYPQTPGFIESIQKYNQLYEPSYIVIHSTISPSILEELQPTVSAMVWYSPVRGNQRDGMKEGLKDYTKYVASTLDHAPGEEDITTHLVEAGFKVKVVYNSDALIWAKLLDLAWYGLNIAFYQEVERIVPGNGYAIVRDFIRSTPQESKGKVRREVFYGGHIGGHCVIQGIEKILADRDVPMLRAVIDSNMKRFVELASEKPPHHP